MAPIISPFEFDEAVFYGESIQIMCHIPKGDMPLVLTWSFRNEPIKKNDNIVITKVGHRSAILSIPAATERHSGNYTCTASNTVASTNHTAMLNVQGTFLIMFYCVLIFFLLNLPLPVPPHIVPLVTEELVFAGESVQLNCHVSKGDQPLTITWSFHGKELSSHQGISTMKIGQRTSLLTISSATASHSGEYSCHAFNHAGQTVHSTVINVHGIPIVS